jgi:hypothetical protein
MREADWLASSDPEPMLAFLRAIASDRKLRLFQVACADYVWHLLADERSRIAVAVAERFADGLATQTELANAFSAACEAWKDIVWSPGDRRAERGARVAKAAAREAMDAATVSLHARARYADRWLRKGTSGYTRSCLLREIFGNPIRPAELNRDWIVWNDGCVVKIAQGIYDERAFDRMPILHDALLDAGCDDEAILAHCRSEAPHVRGCWVVDLLLGKS